MRKERLSKGAGGAIFRALARPSWSHLFGSHQSRTMQYAAVHKGVVTVKAAKTDMPQQVELSPRPNKFPPMFLSCIDLCVDWRLCQNHLICSLGCIPTLLHEQVHVVEPASHWPTRNTQRYTSSPMIPRSRIQFQCLLVQLHDTEFCGPQRKRLIRA